MNTERANCWHVNGGELQATGGWVCDDCGALITGHCEGEAPAGTDSDDHPPLTQNGGDMQDITTTIGFSLDWNEWRKEWREWHAAHAGDLLETRERFPGKNFLADEVLGTWKVRGRVVELSEVVMPDFGARPRQDIRYIGVTWDRDKYGECPIVDSFQALEETLGL